MSTLNVGQDPANEPKPIQNQVDQSFEPAYREWNQQYRQSQSFLEEYRLRRDQEQAKQVNETLTFPQAALQVVHKILGAPQQAVLNAAVGKQDATVDELLDKMIPGGTDQAIMALKQKGFGDNTIGALFTLPAVALTLGTDPLNAIPGVSSAKAGAKAASATAKATPKFTSKSVVSGSSISTDEAAVSKIGQVNIDQIKVRPEDHPDPVNPEKVAKIQERLKKKPDSMPALELQMDKTGEIRLRDGRHRLEAMKAEGADSVPATLSISREAAKDPALVQTAHELTHDPVFAKLLDEKGHAQLPLMLAVTRAAIGGTAGALVGDEEDRLRNVLVGAGLGAAASPSVVRRLVNVFAQNPKLAEPRFLETAEGQRMAQLAKMEKALPQSEMAAQYQSTVKAFTESRTIPQIKEEADLLNKYGKVTEDSIAQMQPGTILNDAEKTALVNVVSKSGARLKELAENVKPEFPESYDEFIRQLYRHGQLDARRLGTASEEGRVLRMEQELAGEKQFLDQYTGVMSRLKFGQSKERMVELVKQMKSQDELVNFAKNVTRPGFGDMFVELWVNGLLSGPKTHVVNTFGNVGFLALNTAERGLARMTGSGNIAPGEASAMLSAGIGSFQDSMRLAWKAFKNDAVQVDGKLEGPTRALTVDNINHLGLMQKLNLKIDDTGVIGRAIDGVSSWFFRMPGRALMASDEFFRSMAFNMELHAQAVREATAEISAQGLTGKAATDAYNQIFQNIVSNPSTDLVSKAKSFAAYSTFTKELGPGGKALQELANSNPMGRIALPFVRAPINLFKAGLVERTALGLLSKQVRDTIAKGGADADLAMTKMAMGSMTSAMMMTWAASGLITGQGPKDKSERDIWIANGWQPHSINVSKLLRGGDEDAMPKPGDRMVQFDKLEPLGMILGMSADMSEAWGQLTEDDRDAASLAVVLGTAFSKNFASKTFVKGVAGLTNALSDPDNNFERWMIHEAGTLVPMSGATGAVTREIDPTIRDAQTVVDGMRTRVWPFSTDVFPDRDVFGNPKSYTPGLGPDIVSPFYTSRVKGHPVLEAMIEDKTKISTMQRSVGGIDLKSHPELYDRLQVLAGHEVKDAFGRNYEQALSDVIQQAKTWGHTTGPESWRAERFREVTREFRSKAVNQLLDENPDLAEAVGVAKAEKQAKKTGISIH